MLSRKANRRAGDAAAAQITFSVKKPFEQKNSRLTSKKQADREIVAAIARSNSRTSLADAFRAALKGRRA